MSTHTVPFHDKNIIYSVKVSSMKRLICTSFIFQFIFIFMLAKAKRNIHISNHSLLNVLLRKNDKYWNLNLETSDDTACQHRICDR